MRALHLGGAGKADITVEMALVAFIEDDAIDTIESGIAHPLPELLLAHPRNRIVGKRRSGTAANDEHHNKCEDQS